MNGFLWPYNSLKLRNKQNKTKQNKTKQNKTKNNGTVAIFKK